MDPANPKDPKDNPFFIKTLHGICKFGCFLDLGKKMIQTDVFLHDLMVSGPCGLNVLTL